LFCNGHLLAAVRGRECGACAKTGQACGQSNLLRSFNTNSLHVLVRLGPSTVGNTIFVVRGPQQTYRFSNYVVDQGRRQNLGFAIDWIDRCRTGHHVRHVCLLCASLQLCRSAYTNIEFDHSDSPTGWVGWGSVRWRLAGPWQVALNHFHGITVTGTVVPTSRRWQRTVQYWIWRCVPWLRFGFGYLVGRVPKLGHHTDGLWCVNGVVAFRLIAFHLISFRLIAPPVGSIAVPQSKSNYG